AIAASGTRVINRSIVPPLCGCGSPAPARCAVAARGATTACADPALAPEEQPGVYHPCRDPSPLAAPRTPRVRRAAPERAASGPRPRSGALAERPSRLTGGV